MPHIPVLLHEVIELLVPKSGEFFIDGTVGSGGHAEAIIANLMPNGIFLGIDWDCDAVERAAARLKTRQLKRMIFVCDTYSNMPRIMKQHKFPKANGLLIDLGLSSEQLEESGRGFSFQRNETLDMRYSHSHHHNHEYDREKSVSDYRANVSARELVNELPEEELADLLWKYGEERFARRIAGHIVATRKKSPIATTDALVQIVNRAVPQHGQSRIHSATRVFQALRIAVNRELTNLAECLDNLSQILERGGKAGIISFHSLEDRMVKRAFQTLVKEEHAALLTKKPVRPSREEALRNPRSRSAKLRAIQLS